MTLIKFRTGNEREAGAAASAESRSIFPLRCRCRSSRSLNHFPWFLLDFSLESARRTKESSWGGGKWRSLQFWGQTRISWWTRHLYLCCSCRFWWKVLWWAFKVSCEFTPPSGRRAKKSREEETLRSTAGLSAQSRRQLGRFRFETSPKCSFKNMTLTL